MTKEEIKNLIGIEVDIVDGTYFVRKLLSGELYMNFYKKVNPESIKRNIKKMMEVTENDSESDAIYKIIETFRVAIKKGNMKISPKALKLIKVIQRKDKLKKIINLIH